jgi:MipA family protein
MKLRQLMTVGAAILFSGTMAVEVVAGVPDLEAWTFGSTATRIENNSEWRVNVGGGVGFGPDYIGSDDYTSHFLPVADIEWRGAYFLSTQRGLGLNIVRRRQTKAGPRITWSAGRDASDNTDLAGMGDLKSSVEAGFFAQHYNGPWRLEADLRYGLNSSGHHGIVGSASLALGGRLSEDSSLILGGSTTFGSATYMIANFGVTSAQATASRAAYTPTAGFRDFSGFASIVYNVNKNIYLTIDGRGTLMMDQAANSPLVKATDQYFAGSTLGYRF